MRTRLLTAALVAGTGALGLLPLAVAATPAVVAPTVESWFQPNPSCATPAGCLTPGALPVAPPVEVPTSPFPAGTLHVGAGGGQETARTYLGLPSSALTGVTQARLTVPLDVEPGSGGSSPETAKLQVCLTQAPLAVVQGSFAEPPAADCDRSAAVAYVATPAPLLEADLGPLLAGLPEATGLVLLPDAASLTPTDSWRVVFSARSRTDAPTAPAALAVVLADAPAAPPPAPAGQPAAPEAPPLGVQSEPSFDDVPSAPAPEPELGGPLQAPVEQVALGEAPQTAGDDVVQVEQVGFPETVRVGYAYPAIWLLPLALLVVVPLVARLLTADLTPVTTAPTSD